MFPTNRFPSFLIPDSSSSACMQALVLLVSWLTRDILMLVERRAALKLSRVTPYTRFYRRNFEILVRSKRKQSCFNPPDYFMSDQVTCFCSDLELSSPPLNAYIKWPIMSQSVSSFFPSRQDARQMNRTQQTLSMMSRLGLTQAASERSSLDS